jgi:holo-[acyl-carrier protein] synthase
MILGLGSDICDIRRIERVLERFGDRFLERVFTEPERRRAERRNGQNRAGTMPRFVAMRLAPGAGHRLRAAR